MTIPEILATIAIALASVIIIFWVIYLIVYHFAIERPYQKWLNNEKAFNKFRDSVKPIIREK
jgi:hypothetical protein